MPLFNNISVILWRPALLVEENGVPGENYRSAESHWQIWSHNVVSSKPRHEQDSNSQFSGDRHWLDKDIIGEYLSSNCF